MAVPVLVYTPVTPRNGGEVHATSLREPTRTVCNRVCNGWIIQPSRLTCSRCKELIHLPVKEGAKVVPR